MADTIEEFVNKLQQEGVQAGQATAEKLQADAQAQADQTIADAQAKAEKIVADAKSEGENILARAKTEVELAARDTIGRLRETLSTALNALLAESAKTALDDMDFIGRTLHDIVMLYAKADIQRHLLVKINVPDNVRKQLKTWALKELGQEVLKEVRPSFDLKGRLDQAGFEYEVHGGTVEVTLDSVVETLSELVTPALREVLTKATEPKKKKSTKKR
jgi:vacuolar-type H+-ATPase subunit H